MLALKAMERLKEQLRHDVGLGNAPTDFSSNPDLVEMNRVFPFGAVLHRSKSGMKAGLQYSPIANQKFLHRCR